MRLAAICLGFLLAPAMLLAQTSANKFDAGNSSGLPLYPKAVPSEHDDGRGTVSIIDGARAHRLAAGAYLTPDKPEKVLEFYRDRLQGHGQVVECSGGKNKEVDLELNPAAFADPSLCNAEDFAASGTELKAITGGEQKIVVVLPHGSGAEIALVSVKP